MQPNIVLCDKIPDVPELLALYQDAGWSAYTARPEKLHLACQQSLKVITAWSGMQLVGLARAVGDGETILYVQDLLVHSSHRRNGIGRALLEMLLSEYPHVRQRVLLADRSEELAAFYHKVGFLSAEQAGTTAYVQLGRR